MLNVYRPYCAALISVIAAVTALPVFWHDNVPVGSVKYSTGGISLYLEGADHPDVDHKVTLMPGESTTQVRKYAIDLTGDNLAAKVNVTLPAAQVPVLTKLEVIDSSGAQLAVVEGDGFSPLEACFLIPAVGDKTKTGSLKASGQVVLTFTDPDGPPRWGEYDRNRPRVESGRLGVTVAQIRTGDGFTDPANPCEPDKDKQ